MKSQVEAWSHRVRVLGKISKRQPQSAYAVLGMPLHFYWNYLQKNVPRVDTLMGPIEEALRDTFFPALFEEKDINRNFWKILGRSVNRGGLGILDPRSSSESAYNTSKVTRGELVGSILGNITDLKYVGHRYCVRGASAGARKEQQHVEMADLDRQKELAGGQEKNCLYRATRNGAWLSAITHQLNVTYMSWEEFWGNLCLRYGMMFKDIIVTCNG